MTAAVPEELLAGFLARMDQGEVADFEAFVDAHPEHAMELRRLFEEECERLESSARRRHASTAFSAEIVGRLSGRAGYDRYSIRGEIGRGGMGTVLRVFDEDLRRELAMKVTRDDASGLAGSSRASNLARFLEEAQVTGQLDHPGIVPVHELGLDPEGRVYFTMKLVKGRTFVEVLDCVRDGRIGWTQARALGVIQRVCEAMAYAHDKGVLHRDLKPANIMVGAFGEVYVMDWGLARILGAADPGAGRHFDSSRGEQRSSHPDSSLLTRDGQVVGTPAYMPPEQAEGRVAEIGPHSDVYAVGAMIYHLLAGHPPRVDATLPPSAPAELAAICEKAMDRDWRGRYPNMAAMAADLAAFLEGRVVGAYETGALAEARKWVRRNRGLAVAVAAAVLALVAGLVASLALKARSDESSLRAQKVASFLEETLGGVKPSVARGHDTTMLRAMMDRAWTRIESGELAAAPEAEMRLTWVIGSAYRDIAQYDLAERLLRRAVAIGRALPRSDDACLAASLSDLSLVQQRLGQPAEARVLAREALEMRRRLSSGDGQEVAASLVNLSGILDPIADREEGERLLREALAMHERLFPGDHQSTAENLQNLAVRLLERGELGEAETHLRRSMEMLRRILPDDHPTVAAGLSNLASLLQRRGDLAGAEPLEREALEMRRRLFPGDHTDIVTSLSSLGTARFGSGDLVEAESLYREALEMARRLFPGDNAEVATCLDNLGAALFARGDSAGAEPLHREALAMRRRLFPGNHPDVAIGLNNLAMLLRKLGQVEEAESLMIESLEMLERLVPGGDHDSARVATNLASLLEDRGDFAGAEPLYGEALRINRATLSGPHPSTVRAAIGLGRVRLAREDFAAAEEMLADTAALLREAQDGVSSDRERCLKLLVDTCTAWERSSPGAGHGERAETWAKELAEVRGR